MAEASSSRAVFFALGANFSIFIAKSIAAAITGSGAMLAEAVHSLSDCGNQGLLLLGAAQAKRKATADAPLGFGKAVYFWSFLVALLLFAVGGMFSVYQGWQKLHHPEPIQHVGLAVGVLVFAILAEGAALRTCLKLINARRGHRSLWQWFRTTRQADLVVVFAEDVAALAGIALALAAIVLSAVTGNPIYDAIGTICVGALLIVVAVFIAIEIQAMLIGHSAAPWLIREMQAFLAERPEIKRVFSLITLQLGNDIMVSIKALMTEERDAQRMIADINRVEADLRVRFPQVRWSFFEPDIED